MWSVKVFAAAPSSMLYNTYCTPRDLTYAAKCVPGVWFRAALIYLVPGLFPTQDEESHFSVFLLVSA